MLMYVQIVFLQFLKIELGFLPFYLHIQTYIPPYNIFALLSKGRFYLFLYFTFYIKHVTRLQSQELRQKRCEHCYRCYRRHTPQKLNLSSYIGERSHQYDEDIDPWYILYNLELPELYVAFMSA